MISVDDLRQLPAINGFLEDPHGDRLVKFITVLLDRLADNAGDSRAPEKDSLLYDSTHPAASTFSNDLRIVLTSHKLIKLVMSKSRERHTVQVRITRNSYFF